MTQGIKVKAKQAAACITKTIKARLVPFVTSSPGCGKSSIVHQIAKEFSLKVIDLRLSQCDPSDLNGFPQITNGKAGYIPMNTFPLENDPIPEGYSGWLLFFDEFNSAAPAVQAASYKIILDGMVGMENLHKNVAIVCAGNKDTDNAIVESMSTAMQSRLVHLELEVDHAESRTWFIDNKFDQRIISFLDYKPKSLMTFEPDHSDSTYACPRTWEFANRILKVCDNNDPDLLPLLSGALSEGVAREFVVFCRIEKDLPKIEQIEANPTGIPVPQESSIMFALTGSLANRMNVSNVKGLIQFIKRLPPEFQIICIRDSVKRVPALVKTDEIKEWLSTSSAKLF